MECGRCLALRFMGRCASLAMRALYLVDCSLHLALATSRISVLTASIFSAIIGSSSALRDDDIAMVGQGGWWRWCLLALLFS